MPTLLDALELCKNGLLELRVLPELDLVTLLMEQIQDHDVREVWQAVGEAGLEMLAEMQHSWREEWAELIQPLNCLASGTYKEEELAPWARMAAEIYQKMDDAQQQHVAGCDSMCQESLEALILLHSFSSQSSEARNTATTFLAAMRDRSACQLQHEVSGLADGKDLGITASDVDVALVEVKAGLKVLAECPWQVPEPHVACKAMAALLAHEDPTVRRAAALALQDAEEDDTASEVSWEMVGEEPGPPGPSAPPGLLQQLEDDMELSELMEPLIAEKVEKIQCRLLVFMETGMSFTDTDGDHIRIQKEGSAINQYVNGRLEIQHMPYFNICPQKRSYKDSCGSGRFRPTEDVEDLMRKRSLIFMSDAFFSSCLSSVCGLNQSDADEITILANNEGMAVVGTYDLDIAESYFSRLKAKGLAVDLVPAT